MSDSDELSEGHAETDEDDHSDAETHADGRFSFTGTVPDESPMQNENDDSIAAETEF